MEIALSSREYSGIGNEPSDLEHVDDAAFHGKDLGRLQVFLHLLNDSVCMFGTCFSPWKCETLPQDCVHLPTNFVFPGKELDEEVTCCYSGTYISPGLHAPY